MMKRKSGMIVNISSMAGLVPVPVRTMYSSSKFALSGFGKSLRAEVKPFGIDIIQIYPGYISTNISSNAMTGTGEKFAKKDSNIESGLSVTDCVKQILKAMKLRKIEYIVGGMFYQFAPVLSLSGLLVDWYCAKKFKS